MATIKIPMDGQDFEVPQWATEATLNRLASAIDGAGSTGSKKLDTVITKLAGKSPGDKDSMAGAIGGIVHASDTLGKSGKIANTAFTAASTAISSTAGVISTLASSKGSFSDLNPIIDSVTQAFGALVKDLPLIGGVLAGLGEGAGAIMKLNNAIADELMNGIDALTVQGFSLAEDFVKVGARATDAGIGFSKFSEVATQNARALTALGGSFTEGSNRFLGITKLLAREDSEFGMALRRFGMSAEDTADFLADFLDSQVGANIGKVKSDQEVAKAAFDVAKQQRIVAELTGRQADDLKAQARFVRENQSFDAMLQEMRLNEQHNQAKALQDFVSSLPTQEAQMLAMQMLRTNGAAASQETALLDLATDGKLGESIMKGFEMIFAAGEDEAINQVSKATAGSLVAIASVAQNTEMLRVASIGLLGAGNNFSTEINKILPDAKTFFEILENNNGDIDLALQEFTKKAEDVAEGNREGISKANEDLITGFKELEQSRIKLEKMVMDNLGGILAMQVDVIARSITVINDLLDRAMGGKDISEMTKEEVKENLSQEEIDGLGFFKKYEKFGFESLPFSGGLGDLNFSPERDDTVTGLFGGRRYDEDGNLRSGLPGGMSFAMPDGPKNYDGSLKIDNGKLETINDKQLLETIETNKLLRKLTTKGGLLPTAY